MSGDYAKQYAFTAPFEGTANHMYLDSKGIVTTGVGCALATVGLAKILPFEPANDVETEWTMVKALPPGKGLSFYQKQTKCRLSDLAVRNQFSFQCNGFESLLRLTFPKFMSFPEPARIALMDMAFNMGVGTIKKEFPNFTAAVMQQNWDMAAAECHRQDVQEERNRATIALFRKCAPANRNV